MSLPTDDRIAAHGRQLGTLLPPGRAFSREPGGRQAQLLEGLGWEFANLEARTRDLLREFDPTLALELLDDWEAALGLPDPCVGELETLEERRNAIVARLVALAGANARDLVELAATLGYQVRLLEHEPFQVGRSRVGDELSNHQRSFRVGTSTVGEALTNREEWLWTVDVVAPLNTVRSFQTGRSVVGEPLATWNNALLECTLGRVAPAHILLRFLYELQIQLDAIASSQASALPILFELLYAPEIFDLIAHEHIVLANAVSPTSGELWNLLAAQTAAVELPVCFVTAEMVRNGGTLKWLMSGVLTNATGSGVDMVVEFFNGFAAVSPFMTICVEGLPSDAASDGNFSLQAALQIRNTGQAQGYWFCIANAKMVADGSTASGQGTPFIDHDPLRIFAAVSWNADTTIVVRARKKTSNAAVIKFLEFQCICLPTRSGASPR